MTRSTGGEQEITADQLRPFEGLVLTTARMFASQVRREEDDLAQELRVIVWKALRKFDGTRSPTGMKLQQYVYGCLANKIKSYKRDAAREAQRRERFGIGFLHIEGMHRSASARDSNSVTGPTVQENFDALWNFVTHDETYGQVDGQFVLPSTVTDREANVLLLLLVGLSRPEIAVRLGIGRPAVDTSVNALRRKFSDLRPRADSSPVEAVVGPAAVAA